MDWYWWVLGFLALIVIGAFLGKREDGAAAQNGPSPDGRTVGGTGGAPRCDVCGKAIDMEEAAIVRPSEMRLIAHNGYGEVVPVLAVLPLQDRRAKFQYLTYANDTDWALCRSCYQLARPYMAAANPGGMSQADMDELYENGLKPFFGDDTLR